MSPVDICNLALAHLGDEAGVESIAPTDGSVQSGHCGRFYPLARRALLQMNTWGFATTRVELAQVTNPAPLEWKYAYAVPSDLLRPMMVIRPGVAPSPYQSPTDERGHQFLTEAAQDGSMLLYCNIDVAVLRYVRDVEDTNSFPPDFAMALARLLASYLAGPILKGSSGTQVAMQQMKLFQAEYATAAAADANSALRDTYSTRVPAHLGQRTNRQVWKQR